MDSESDKILREVAKANLPGLINKEPTISQEIQSLDTQMSVKKAEYNRLKEVREELINQMKDEEKK